MNGVSEEKINCGTDLRSVAWEHRPEACATIEPSSRRVKWAEAIKCGFRNSDCGVRVTRLASPVTSFVFPVTCHVSPVTPSDGLGGGFRYRGFVFRVTRLASLVTPSGWRLAGLDFFGTPGSIDQISDPDQAFLTTDEHGFSPKGFF